MKTRQSDVPEWDIEVAFLTNKQVVELGTAHTFVILRWMLMGDLRPFGGGDCRGQDA
jgi:hypothetical protein